jgi:hypothetical protein
MYYDSNVLVGGEWEYICEMKGVKPTLLYRKISKLVISEMKNRRLGYSAWKVEPDISINHPTGMEIISPPMRLKDFLSVTPKIFKFIDETGYTSNNCGFHVNISLKEVPDLASAVDLFKLALFIDEGYIWKHFKTREESEYCKSVHRVIHNQFDAGKILSELVTDKVTKKFPESHALALDTSKLEKNYIEFRYLGGENYHHNYACIRSTVMRFVNAVSVACDPTYRRKEYIQKLYRIATKQKECLHL